MPYTSSITCVMTLENIYQACYHRQKSINMVQSNNNMSCQGLMDRVANWLMWSIYYEKFSISENKCFFIHAFQYVQMASMVRTVHTVVLRSATILPVTSLQQMESVLIWSVNQDLKETIAPYVIIK